MLSLFDISSNFFLRFFYHSFILFTRFQAMDLAGLYKKLIIVEEYGAQGSSARTAAIQNVMTVTNTFRLSSMIWEVLIPTQANDYEFFADDSATWSTLTTLTLAALAVPPSSLLTNSALCEHSYNCASNCCTNTVAGTDGRLRCADYSSAPSCNAPSADTGLADWDFCAVSSQCNDGCCSKEFSNDNKFKCTPGGSHCL